MRTKDKPEQTDIQPRVDAFHEVSAALLKIPKEDQLRVIATCAVFFGMTQEILRELVRVERDY